MAECFFYRPFSYEYKYTQFINMLVCMLSHQAIVRQKILIMGGRKWSLRQKGRCRYVRGRGEVIHQFDYHINNGWENNNKIVHYFESWDTTHAWPILAHIRFSVTHCRVQTSDGLCYPKPKNKASRTLVLFLSMRVHECPCENPSKVQSNQCKGNLH